jgi:capsule polysaccharide modification protein KpsS
MKILISLSGDIYDMPIDVLKKWKITENKKIGDTYFMRESGGTYFSMSEHYYNLYRILLRQSKIDSIINITRY